MLLSLGVLVVWLCLQFDTALCDVDMDRCESCVVEASDGGDNNEPGLKGTVKWPFSDTDFKYRIQSPIDLITHFAQERSDLQPLRIHQPLQSQIQAEVLNNGHTVMVYIKEKDVEKLPYLMGGPLQKDVKYVFEQMHFHWGRHDEWGSEHFVDGESFAVEVHLVFFKSSYGTFKKALKQHDGLTVLTVFGEVADKPNDYLNPLSGILPQIEEPDASVQLSWKDAMSWAISGMELNEEYYSYPGSLTTKPHSENVVFILLNKPVTISSDQLQKFRKLHHEKHDEAKRNAIMRALDYMLTVVKLKKPAKVETLDQITRNKRKLQPRNHRPIIKGKISLEIETETGVKKSLA